MAIGRYCELIYNDFSGHIKSFSWESKNVKIALKSALACVVSVTLAYMLELNMVLYAGMSSLIMSEANMGATFKKGFCRAAGTFVGYLLALFIFGLFIQNHLMFTICIMVLCTVCYYKYATSEYAYFWLLIIVTFAIIAVDGIYLADVRDVVYVAFNRMFSVMIGIAVTLIIHVYIWPIYATSDLIIAHSKMRKTAFRLFKEILNAYFIGEKPETGNVERFARDFKVKFQKFAAMKESSSVEKRNCKELFFRLTTESIKLYEAIENFMSFYNSQKKHHPLSFQKKFVKIYKNIDINLNELYKAILNHRQDRIIQLKKKVEEDLKRYELKYRKECKLGRHKSYTVADVFIVNEAFMLADEVFNLYFRLLSVEEMFKKSGANIRSSHQENKNLKSTLKRITFLNKSVVINIPALKYGIRTGISMVTVIWLWWLLEFPEGVGGLNIVIAIVTVCTPDVIYSNIKGLQRLIGCSIGAGLGFLFLSLQDTSSLVYFSCLFVVTFLGAYIKTGAKNTSYIGLQISLAYLVATTHDYAQVTDVVGISFRIVGILMGIAVSWIIGQFIFVEDYFEKLKSQMRDYCRSVSRFRFKKRKDFNKSYEISELKVIKFLYDNLHDAQKISDKEFTDAEKWYILNRRLVYAIRELSNAEEILMDFICNIKPDIFADMEFLVSSFRKNDRCDFKILKEKIRKVKDDLEDIKITIRRESLIAEMDMDFKRRISHYILSLRRVLARFEEIYELNIEKSIFQMTFN